MERVASSACGSGCVGGGSGGSDGDDGVNVGSLW